MKLREHDFIDRMRIEWIDRIKTISIIVQKETLRFLTRNRIVITGSHLVYIYICSYTMH
jgi:hypothetical protein